MILLHSRCIYEWTKEKILSEPETQNPANYNQIGAKKAQRNPWMYEEYNRSQGNAEEEQLIKMMNAVLTYYLPLH